MTEPLPNPQALVDSTRIFGTVNIGSLAPKIVQHAGGDGVRLSLIRESVRPYLSAGENASLDQLLHDMGATPTPSPTPTPTPAPALPPFETLPQTVNVVPTGSATLVFPPDWAPMEEKVAFYTSQEYFDWEAARAASTAPTASGDPIFDAYVQNGVESFFANSVLLTYQIAQQQRAAYNNQLRTVQRQLAERGWHLTQEDIRTLAAGGVIEVRTTTANPTLHVSTAFPAGYDPTTDIVVIGGRAHLAPSFSVSSVIAQVPIAGTGGLLPASTYSAAQRADAKAFFAGKNPHGDDIVEYLSDIADPLGATRVLHQSRIDDILRTAEELYLAAFHGPNISITGPNGGVLTQAQMRDIFTTEWFQIVLTAAPFGGIDAPAAFTTPNGSMEFSLGHPDWNTEATRLSSATVANVFIFLHEFGHKIDARVGNASQPREAYANHWAAVVGRTYGLAAPSIADIQQKMGRTVQP